MESKVKVWIARDKSGALWLYQSIPDRDVDEWFCKEPCCKMDSSNFPSVQWEDDAPTEAYITLAEPQEQSKPKQEIDWEQRRYEIVKEISAAIYSRPTVKTALLNVYQIISAADTIIKELKEKSK